MGFTFQKLFAGNYMQWERDGFRIWKKGSDITHDRYDLFKLIRFLRTNPVMRHYKNFHSFYKFYSDADKNIYDYYPMDEENKQKYKDNMFLWSDEGGYDENNPPPYLGSSDTVTDKILDTLKELNELGWYELDYYPED